MSINIQTIADIRKLLREELSGLYNEKETESVTNVVLKYVFSIDKLFRLADPGFKITEESVERILQISDELKTGKPVQYIVGETEFYGLRIKVNGSVLIPRNETEELVDLVIRENGNFNGTICDLCTGSGCIAIALAGNMPGARIYGTDISEEAIDTARENARINKADIGFFAADLMEPWPASIPGPGIIVSNPPYVTGPEKHLMHSNVMDFEPHTALFVPDSDPLVFYRRLLELCSSLLPKNGRFYFEINESMGGRTAEMAAGFGMHQVEIIKDLNGKDRIIKGTNNG